MLHWLAWLVARLVYRLRVAGADNIPKTGPALLVSNHVSYADWLVLMAASRRKVRTYIPCSSHRAKTIHTALRPWTCTGSFSLRLKSSRL